MLVKAHDLEKGSRFRLTGDAENPAEQVDTGVYEVVDIEKASITMPDGRTFPGNTFMLVKNEQGVEREQAAIAPWVSLIKVE